MTELQLQELTNKLNEYIEKFDDHSLIENERWLHLVETQQNNAQAITELVRSTTEINESLKKVSESTKGAVEAHDMAIKTAKGLGLISAAIIGTSATIGAVVGVINLFSQ